MKEADLTRYRNLAFATHGLMAGDFKGLAEPALVLTPPQQRRSGRRSWWWAKAMRNGRSGAEGGRPHCIFTNDR